MTRPQATWRYVGGVFRAGSPRCPSGLFLDGRYSRPAESAPQLARRCLFFVQCGIRTVKRGSRILRGFGHGFFRRSGSRILRGVAGFLALWCDWGLVVPGWAVVVPSLCGVAGRWLFLGLYAVAGRWLFPGWSWMFLYFVVRLMVDGFESSPRKGNGSIVPVLVLEPSLASLEP